MASDDRGRRAQRTCPILPHRDRGWLGTRKPRPVVILSAPGLPAQANRIGTRFSGILYYFVLPCCYPEVPILFYVASTQFPLYFNSIAWLYDSRTPAYLPRYLLGRHVSPRVAQTIAYYEQLPSPEQINIAAWAPLPSLGGLAPTAQLASNRSRLQAYLE